MPRIPVPAGKAWQLQVQPVVVYDFRRPFYIAPSNNQPGGSLRPVPRIVKPAMLVHIPKQTKGQALSIASTGSMPGSFYKITDLPPGTPQLNVLQANGPSLGCAPTKDVKPFQK